MCFNGGAVGGAFGSLLTNPKNWSWNRSCLRGPLATSAGMTLSMHPVVARMECSEIRDRFDAHEKPGLRCAPSKLRLLFWWLFCSVFGHRLPVYHAHNPGLQLSEVRI